MALEAQTRNAAKPVVNWPKFPTPPTETGNLKEDFDRLKRWVVQLGAWERQLREVIERDFERKG